MITAYHRPKTIDEALRLLAREGIDTRPLSGGVSLSGSRDGDIEVVDLQDLGLDNIIETNEDISIQAGVTLRVLHNYSNLPAGVADVIDREVSINIQNAGTVCGLVATCDGRSPLCTVLISLGSKATWLPGNEKMDIGSRFRQHGKTSSRLLMREIVIPKNVSTYFEMVARSPLDKPILCVSITKWPTGRLRVALGGWGEYPVLAYDGMDSHEAIQYSQNICLSSDDEWASSEYRMHLAGILTQRLLLG